MSFEPNYPRAVYKLGETLQYSHNPKQDKEFIEAGWTFTPILTEYPKTLYKPDGTAFHVKNKAEEDECIATQNCTLKPIPRIEPVVRTVAEGSQANNGRLDALEDSVYALNDNMVALKQELVALKQELSGKTKKA